MTYDNQLTLISKTCSTDDAGDPIETEIATDIFCSELSIGQTEFYQGMATGLKPEIKLGVNRFEYNNEKKIKYNNVTYDVIRTYAKDAEILEITLGGGINATT